MSQEEQVVGLFESGFYFHTVVCNLIMFYSTDLCIIDCLCFCWDVFCVFAGSSWRRSYSFFVLTGPQSKISQLFTKSVPGAIEDCLRMTLMEWKSLLKRRGALF